MHIHFTILLLSLLILQSQQSHQPVVTLVTGLWDLKRGELKSQYSRGFDFYLGFLAQLLPTESNLIVFGDAALSKFVGQHRNRTNTLFLERDMDYFSNKWYAKRILQFLEQTKRDASRWEKYRETPQYGLPMYNPVLFSKLFLISEAIEVDPFGSEYYVWVDAGLIHVEQPNEFVPRSLFQRFPLFFDGPWTYHTLRNEHPVGKGFDFEGRQYTKNEKMKEMVWGGYYGGRMEAVTTIRAIFENLVSISLDDGEMWTEETLYSIMIQRYPYLINHIHDVNLQVLRGPLYDPYRHRPIEQLRQIVVNFSMQICSEPATPMPTSIIVPSAPSSHRLYSLYRSYLKWFTSKHRREMSMSSLVLLLLVIAYCYLRRYAGLAKSSSELGKQ